MKRGIVRGILLCWLAVSLVPGAEDRKSLGMGLAQSPGIHLEYEAPRFLAGAIYGRGVESNKLLFRFEREATRSGDTLNVRRDYALPDGRLAARERVVYEGNEPVAYEMQDLQTGERGTAKIRRGPANPAKGTIEFEYLKEGASRPKTSTEALRESILVGDMLGPFLAPDWDALARGEKIKCRCIVVSRRETVGFTFVKESEATGEGRRLVILKMEASSRFVATLVDPLFLTIEAAPPHRVLQYVGRTTPKIRIGGKWKTLDAITVFDWKTAR
jgi:hypothetical protein